MCDNYRVSSKKKYLTGHFSYETNRKHIRDTTHRPYREQEWGSTLTTAKRKK
jgi:hypothetical protein